MCSSNAAMELCSVSHSVTLEVGIMQVVKYGPEGALGIARTWPQHACALPTPGDSFDWEGDRPLNTPLEDLVIYEMHVRGFTWDKSAGVSNRGTCSCQHPVPDV